MTKGMLLVMMDPPAALEEELNAWYDTEHLPERLAVPGIETAIRYVCDSGGPKYLALYDLSSPDILESAPYLAVSGDNFSPWTRRVTATARVHRGACVTLHPSDPSPLLPDSHLQIIRFRDASEKQLPDVLKALDTANTDGQSPAQSRLLSYQLNGIDYLFLLREFHSAAQSPSKIDVFGEAASKIDLCANYRPYA
ncbi:MAG: hypothetical protein COA52_14025 [Hyphomicrobiales bacterium]|nr:MAG: hypothetical protein COA52_14025 [Hyphomicrobiales bacterium]